MQGRVRTGDAGTAHAGEHVDVWFLETPTIGRMGHSDHHEHREHRFLEETLLTVLLWVGAWGAISLLLERFIRSFGGKLLTYLVFILAAFITLCLREYI